MEEAVQEQPKNNIGDLVELAGLFADMKASGDVPKQETIVDVLVFITSIVIIIKLPWTSQSNFKS